MAHIRKRKSGYFLVDKSGEKERWVKLGNISFAEARIVLSRYHNEKTYLKIGMEHDDPITFNAFFPLYLESAKLSKGENTVKNERDIFRKLAQSIGDRQVRHITLEDFERLLDGKANYVRLKIAALRSLYKFGVERRFLKENIILKLKRPKVPILPPKHVEPVVIEKILLCMGEEPRSKFTILLYTGMRPSEMLRLQVEDVDLKKENIIIRQSKTKRFRVIPIHPKLTPILKRILRGKEKGQYLFPGLSHDHQVSIRDALRDACKKAKVPQISPYVFRHQFATMILEKTHDLRLAQQLLGHSDIRMTTRYATVLDHRLKDAVASL